MAHKKATAYIAYDDVRSNGFQIFIAEQGKIGEWYDITSFGIGCMARIMVKRIINKAIKRGER